MLKYNFLADFPEIEEQDRKRINRNTQGVSIDLYLDFFGNQSAVGNVPNRRKSPGTKIKLHNCPSHQAVFPHQCVHVCG